jgi:hypothetical protein
VLSVMNSVPAAKIPPPDPPVRPGPNPGASALALTFSEIIERMIVVVAAGFSTAMPPPLGVPGSVNPPGGFAMMLSVMVQSTTVRVLAVLRMPAPDELERPPAIVSPLIVTSIAAVGWYSPTHNTPLPPPPLTVS